MNKIFKVVWSKTKECYVVVSEVAKNNGGKKKVLASVLATLAIMGAGTQMGTPVHADTDLRYSAVNIAPNNVPAAYGPNKVSTNSIVVGYGNDTKTNVKGNGHVAYGFDNTATEDSTTAIGGGNKATGPAATAVGSFNEATGRNAVAVGNVAKANNTDNIAIGTYSEALTNGQDAYALAMGSYSKANAHMAVGIGALANATGTESTAVGAGSKASAKNSQAFGARNTASGQNATAIGYGNTSKVEDTITMGTSNNANTGGGIAIGQNNLADATANGGRNAGSTQIAIGRDNKAAREDTIAIGRETTAANDLSVAIGNRTEATANAAIAIGTNGAPSGGNTYKTTASGFASIAVGMQSEATASVATAIGGKSSATGASATAVGHGATASEKASVAVGKNATVKKQATTSNYEFSGSNGTPSPAGYKTETITVNSASAPAGGAVAGNYYDAGSGVAIGNGATVSDESDQAVVVGADAKTNGNAHYSVVLGSGSHADASDGFVAGHGSYVKARESIAIGSGANVSGNENIRSQAIGYGATVTGTGAYDATAIGATAQVSGVQGGVALGSGSLLSRTTNSNENAGFNSKFVDGTKVRNRAYTADLTGHNDQWDSGSINTGAVSVGNDTQKRQIINVAAGNKDTDAVNVAQLKNVGVRVGADTNTATITVGSNTSNVAADFLAYNGQLNIKGDNNRVTTVSENDANGKDANVNVKFDYDGLVKAKAGSSVTVNQKTEGGKTVFEIDAAAGGATSTESVVKKAAATNDTNIADISVADNKNTGDVGAKYEVSVSRNAVKDAAREAVTVNNGGTTKADGSYTADSNNPISVTPTKDDTNHNTSYAVTFDGNKAAKQIPLTYKATNNGTTSADQTVKLDKGLNFTGGNYTTASVDTDGKVVFDVNLGTAPTVTDGKPGVPGQAGAAGKDGIATVKTVVDTINNSGWKANAKANGGKLDGAATATVVKPGNTVNYAAGKNLIVKQELETDASNALTGNQTYTYSLNKDIDLTNAGSLTVGDTTVNNDGITIKAPTTPGTTTTDVKLTNTGLNNGGNTITNVAEGQNNTDAVNVKQLKANRTEVKAGDNVVVTSAVDATDNHTIYTVNAVTPAVYTTPDGTKLTKDKDGKFHKEGETAEYTGDIITSFENPKAATGQTTKDGGMIVNNIGSAISGHEAKDTAGTVITSPTYLQRLETAAGDNLTKHAAVNVSDLNSAAKELKASELHIAPTAVKANSTEVKGGSLNAAGTENVYKYDAATKKVTLTYNDGNGKAVTDTKAVIDFSALNTGGTTASTWTAKTSAENTTAGSEVGKHAGNDSQVIGDQNSVDFQAGRNMTVKQTNDGNGNTTINYALDKDLTNLDKVVVNGKDGIAGKDGVTIVGPQGATGAPGMPGTNGIDGKVGISGKDGKDAVSIAGKDGVGTIGLTGPQGPAGTNGKSVDISTENGKQTLVKPEKNNGDQSQRIVYVPKDKDGNPLLDKDNNPIKREVATMDDGLKFAGDDGQTDANKVIAKQLNEKVDIIGGATGTLTDNNIGVNNDGGKLKVQLAKDIDLTNAGSLTVGGTKVNNDGITIKAPTTPGTTTTTTDVKLTNTGLNNGGNTITNVAEGQNNTDAVNVKQLKENRTEVKAGDNVVVTSAVDATDNHTIYTVNAVTPAVYTTPDGTKLTKDKDGKFHKEGETAEYTGDIITSFENPKAATGQTTKDGGMIVNNIGSAIKNQNPTMPAGQTATYLDKLKAAADAGSNVKNAAVNVSDLHNTAEALKASELHIAPTAGGKDADKGGVGITPSATAAAAGAATQAYKYNTNTKQVELTFNDGNGKAVTGPKAVIDLSDLANQITSGYTFSANATANGGTVANETTTPAVATAVENGGTINYAAGKNLTVKQDIDTANKTHTYTYSLDKDLTNLDKVVVNGKDGIAGKDGVTIVGPQGATGAPGIPGTNGIDGKVGISGKDGKDAVSIAGKDGVGTIGLTGPQGPAGTNGKSVDISTENGKQTLVKPEKNNGDQSQRIVYVPKDKDGNPLVDKDNNPIKREVATMDDGLKFAGDDGQTNANKVIAKQLNQQVDIIGGATGTLTDNNIGVNNDGGKLKVQLAKDVDLTNAGSLTVGGTKVNNDGITIKAPTPAAGTTPTTTDVKLTNTGLDNGGNKITNVAEGTNNTDAVNVKQLKENRTEVKAGDNVVVTSAADATDNHTIYTVNAVTPAVYTTPDGEKLTKDKDGKFHKVGETAEYTGDIITSFENPKAAAGQTTKDGVMIVNNIGSAIKNQTPTMPAGQTATYLDKLKAAADDNSNVKNAAVNVSDLHNTAEALKASELHIAPTAGGKDADKGGVASGNTNPGAAAQAYKYNATTKQVELTFNDGNGKAVAGPKAVIDFSDLNTGGTTASSWNVKSSANTTDGGAVADNHNANAQNIADGKGVEFQSGKNLVVKQTNDTTNGNATVEFSLSDNIVAGKDGANGKDGSVGATGKDGSSVVINGADGSIGMTGPKGQDGKDGINGRDGANISMTSAKGEQVLINRDPAHNADTDKAERIVYVPKDASGNPIKGADNKNIVREVATMDDGLKFGGDMGTVNSVKLNKQVDVKGGITDTNKLATGNNIGVTSGIDPTTNNATLNVQLAKDLTGLNSVELGGNTIKTDGDHITITSPDTTPGAAPGATTTTKVANLSDELHITPGTYEVGAVDKDANAKNDEVTLTYTDGNGAEKANTFAKIKGVVKSDLSNINTAGKKVITGLGSVVKAGDNVTVKTDTDATTGQKTYTVNAVTPAVYTKADGTKVVKRPDGTFTTNVDGAPGNDVPASDVIVSFQDAAGNRTGGNSIVNNVGSAIDKPGTATGNTFLTKLDNAATDNPFAAVNVRDLKTTADALKANELHIAPTSGGTDTDKGGVVKTAGSTDMVYKYDAASKTVTLTYNDGNGKAVTGPKAVLDFTDLNIPAGGNNYGFKANATANGGKVANDTTTPAAATAVENGGTVNFAAGKNLTVKQDIDAANKTQTYTFSLDKDLTNLDKIVVNGKDGIDGKDGVSITGPKGESAPGAKDGQDGKVGIAGKDGKDAVSISGKDGVGHIGLTGPQGPAGTPGAPGTPGANIDISTDHGTQTLVKQEAHNNDKSERIVYVPKDANGNPLKDKDNNPIKREVATMDDGLRFTGNNTSKENKQPMNSLVKVQGEGVTENTAGKLEANGQEFKSAAGNIAVEADGENTLTVKMNKDLNLTKDGSVTMGDTVVNNGGITIKAPTTPGTTTTDVKLTNQGLDNGGNKITNVAAGTANTDAVNVKQLKDNVTTVESSDSSIKVVDKNVAGQPGYDTAKGHQYDITINNQGVVNNAQTPVVYTTEDGTKVYKQPDGTFTTNINGTGTVVPANQVIASMNSAGNSSTDPTKLQNVGSSIADKTGTTFLDKINTAATDPNAKYGAVNVTDLKSTSDALIDKGLVFDANNADPKTNKLGSKVTIAGTGALGTGENFADKYNTDNIRTNIKQDAAGNTTVEIGLNKNLKGLESVSVPGKDGVDGQDGVSITGKDGANGVDGKVSIGKDGKDAVSISGKDGIGHIGLTGAAGKDGTNTKADITVKEGKAGVDGKDGITRIVYNDKDGNEHQVATHDDGVKYAGDDAQGTDKTKVISKKLNETIDIVGGADKTKLTDNNIGVNNDGGKLKVQLANELAGINTISNGGSSITFNSNPGGATNTPAVKISGGDLNMGGNKITNLKNGTAPTDAATVGQLTKVEAGDNSVTVAHTTTADGQNVYTIKANPAGTVDLTNVNNRIDQLGEEVGRVGAQGAALSALKPIQYDPLEPTQIMAGYGNYRGNSAIAVGVAHYKNESTMFHGGLSWAGGSSHMMANAGVTWKVGNRDAEAAVADRYRKGPISSAYAVQTEMAAMKAQNAGLKGEVSDLKYENEQIKAQNAGLQSEVEVLKAQMAAMMAKMGM